MRPPKQLKLDNPSITYDSEEGLFHVEVTIKGKQHCVGRECTKEEAREVVRLLRMWKQEK